MASFAFLLLRAATTMCQRAEQRSCSDVLSFSWGSCTGHDVRLLSICPHRPWRGIV